MTGPALPAWLTALDPAWLNAATLGLMFLEGAGVPGIPGVVPMLAQAGMIESGRTTFVEAALWGVAGNWLGSLAGYAFGRRGARRLPASWQARLGGERVRGLLARWGGALVVVIRTVGSLRTPVTWTAGPLGYPFVPFALYSLLGALLHVLVWQYGLWKFGALLLAVARRAETDLLGLALLLALGCGLWRWRGVGRAGPARPLEGGPPCRD
ncbi:membrane protein DedA, SNARE-associated domain [Deinococcus reticulitermitis]|uniref:Membrane protein DedA, SNARE-associated domain n=1 Tax=Deinococcus reticulitermitis TaxID=856736 RepID=A0A1H7AKL4_9DEIO|nr:DedA family protein [Deinococcus reticulitermitis]SEJ66163.1 membrane protein DedA, SNARE-associated domain [Deinococcus reticulitermitis]